MADNQLRTALYRIAAKRPDGACIWATLEPMRQGGEPTRALFCHPRDLEFLAEAGPRFQMASVLEKRGAAARLLPVTIGLYVSIGDRSPTGELTVTAMPRPAPLYLDEKHGGLREIIARAVDGDKAVVFALSDGSTIIDAAPMERDKAMALLGMRERG